MPFSRQAARISSSTSRSQIEYSLCSAVIGAVADKHGVSKAQVALAWLLAQGDDIVPIPGTKRRTYLEQNVAATEHVLDEDWVETLEGAFPRGQAAAGLRYPEFQLKGMGI